MQAVAILSLGVLVACGKQGAEPAASQVARSPGAAPALPASQDREGTHETAPPQAPRQLATALDAAVQPSGRAATVVLRGQADEALRGQAMLREMPSAVEIVLNVEQASPGTRIVALHDTGSCSQPERSGAQRAPVPQSDRHGAYELNPELGALAIDRSGRGTLQVTVPSANLGVEQEGSLLGKALVIYPERRVPKGAAASKDVLACAQILAQ